MRDEGEVHALHGFIVRRQKPVVKDELLGVAQDATLVQERKGVRSTTHERAVAVGVVAHGERAPVVAFAHVEDDCPDVITRDDADHVLRVQTEDGWDLVGIEGGPKQIRDVGVLDSTRRKVLVVLATLVVRARCADGRIGIVARVVALVAHASRQLPMLGELLLTAARISAVERALQAALGARQRGIVSQTRGKSTLA
ncbi:hypothetical protein EXIGLDRAFT_402784 [Exidia glandulosa HHB12029]|uniref:Uncharacterized protein n=1 Tax=Exidia glandulosa HHB12029 TaxID=1314781 RepID=A0A165BK31_EXIGL|nr:hypothetical protein EXIGLDRAFT_402784 [Exidia glandulosa HHB12029]